MQIEELGKSISVDQFMVDYQSPSDVIIVNAAWLQLQLRSFEQTSLSLKAATLSLEAAHTAQAALQQRVTALELKHAAYLEPLEMKPLFSIKG